VDADAWDQRYAARELVWSAEPNQFVASQCAGLAPGRALDLAAGEGRNAIWLARQGWEVIAVDFSQTALDKGRRLAGAVPLTWIRADVTTWRPDGEFDLSLIAYLQLPAPQRAAAVRNAVDALAPGGTFLLVAHDSSNLTEGTGGPQDPAVLMTADDVLDDLAGRDVDVLTAGRVSRAVADDGVAYDCLVRLVRR
jgi:SAM-dependent methyltransferase